MSATTVNTVESYTYKGALQLDATYDVGATGRPWVMLVHGGYWATGGRAQMDGYAQTLNAAGFQAFSIDYSLLPQGVWPQARYDTADALIWIKAHADQFGIDATRGAVLGFSAGGQLAAQMGVANAGAKRTNAVVSISGANDPYRAYRYAHATDGTTTDGYEQTTGYRKLADYAVIATGCPPISTDAPCWDRWKSMTPQNFVTADDSPFFLVQSVDDQIVPGNSSNALRSALANVGVPVTLKMVPGTVHSMDLLDDPDTGAAVLTFLKDRTA